MDPVDQRIEIALPDGVTVRVGRGVDGGLGMAAVAAGIPIILTLLLNSPLIIPVKG